MTDLILEREVAMAICRVQYNGMDPNTPAVRWNGTEMEPQDFPAWRDFLDEARAAIAAQTAHEDARADQLAARVRELEGALEPFAEAEKYMTPGAPDTAPIIDLYRDNILSLQLTRGPFRRARSLLTKGPAQDA